MEREEADLKELGHELVEEHERVEKLANIFAVSGKDRTDYPDHIRSAALDSLLLRCRSLLDFYWQDRPPLGKNRHPDDAFAMDFFVADRDARDRWDSGRALAEPLVGPWSTGKVRVNKEVAHLVHRHVSPAVLPRGERWWTPEYVWALVVVSGRAFEEALDPSAYGGLRGHLHSLWNPYFAEHSVTEIVEHVQQFVDAGSFTDDFGGPQ